MHVKQEVEDGQRSLDARCLERVISVLAALVQVCPGLGRSLCEKYNQEKMLAQELLVRI